MTLDRIIAHKRREVGRIRADHAPYDGRIDVDGAPLPRSQRSLEEALRERHTGFVLECKRASPSSGRLVDEYEPAAVAAEYEPFADAISVLADEKFFGGHPEHVEQVSRAVDRPVLWKDVILEPIQVKRARKFGADAVLLMLSALDDQAFGRCFRTARRLGMDAVAEVHDHSELERALDHPCAPPIIGINNRDLTTLEVDLETTEGLADLVPDGRCLLSESGIRHHGDVRRLRRHCDGFLVGSALTGAPDLGRALRRVIFGEVKVCGLTRPEDARIAHRCGATWGGLIFARQSPRRISETQASEIVAAAPLQPVGVFVDREPAEVARIADILGLEAVQLHGDEGRGYAEQLREILPETSEIWQVARIGEEHRSAPQFPDVRATGPLDRVLLDTYAPDRRGGTGRAFDRSALDAIRHRDRYVLAGGLDPDCAREADALDLGVLDVNSGVEREPGVKSPELLESFFQKLRGRGRGS